MSDLDDGSRPSEHARDQESIEPGEPLVRGVGCASPARLGLQSRGTIRVTAIANTIATYAAPLAIGAMLLTAFVPPRTRPLFGGGPADIAKAAVKTYAFEAYPSWRAHHPDLACPARLEELNQYMNHTDLEDPWGGTYAFSCDGSGILVWSRGEDGLLRTRDDIWSDR